MVVLGEKVVGLNGQDCETVDLRSVGGRRPLLPEASHVENSAVAHLEIIGLGGFVGAFPFVESIGWHEATSTLVCVSEAGLGVSGFRSGIDD